MNPERMRARNIRFTHVFSASLKDMSLNFNKCSQNPGAGHASIAFDPGKRVEGMAYELACVDELFKLDHFETTPYAYSREIMWLEGPGGEPVAAWVYIANRAALASELKPERWYLNHLLQGRDYLSEAYFSRLAATECIEHNPSDRPLHL